jgi:hypothetical protein
LDAGHFPATLLAGQPMTRFSVASLLVLVVAATAPAWAQSTNQLYMTGTGSGNAPVLYTNGVDTNINLAIMPKGTGGVGIGTASPGALLDLGLAGTITGTIRLEGSAAGYVQIQPSATTTSYTLTLPAAAPSVSGYVLSSTTSGVLSWVSGASGSTPLSSLTSATTTNVIDSTNYSQTWGWSTLGSNTALTLTTSMTTGTLLSLTNTNAGSNTGTMLSVTDATTGTGYGVYGVMTGASNSGYAIYGYQNSVTNTGYAGYFKNTGTGTAYGVYSSIASTTTGAAVVGTISGTANSGYAGYFTNTGSTNTGYAGYFSNTDTSGSSNYGVYGITNSTGTSSAGIVGECDSVNCKGGVVGTSTNGTGVYAYSSGANSAALEVIGLGGNYGATAAYIENAGTFSSVIGLNVNVLHSDAGSTAIIGNDTVGGIGIQGQSTGNGSRPGVAGTTDSNSTSSPSQESYGGISAGVNGWSYTTTGSGQGGYFESDSINAGYGIYGVENGTGNTGYGGYFTDTATTGANYGVWAQIASTDNNAAAVVGINGAGTGNGTGIAGEVLSTGAPKGVYGVAAGNANTGYGGYFTNTGTGAVNYGLYASTSSSTGYAGYFVGSVYVTGTVYANLLQLTSDRQLKRNIRTLDTETALDQIASLRPVTFQWKKTGKPDMGLIAQEIAPVYPDLVARGADDRLSVEYISLMAPLIASIQELKKRDDEIEAENEALRRDLEAYKESHP